MSHEVERRPLARDIIVNPATGAIVELSGPTDALAAALDECRDLEWRLRDYKRALSDEVLRRMDHEGTWTAQLGRYTISGDGPRGDTYNGALLHAALEDLVAAGVISEGAMDKAVEEVTEYKVKKAGVNALLKLGPTVVEAVKSAAEENLKPRSVRVRKEPA